MERSKNLNINALFERGYYISQRGQISFCLCKKTESNAKDIEMLWFEVDNSDDSLPFVYARLLAEINYDLNDLLVQLEGVEEIKEWEINSTTSESELDTINSRILIELDNDEVMHNESIKKKRIKARELRDLRDFLI